MRENGVQWCLRLVALLSVILVPAVGAQATSDAAAQGPRFLLTSLERGSPPVPVDITRSELLRQRLTLDFTDLSIKQALAELTAQAGLDLVYSDDVLPAGARVTLRAEGIAVAAALTDILIDANVDVVFHRDGRATLVKRRASVVKADGIIRGRVTEAGTGVPVAGAAVVVEGTRLGSTTSDSGAYRIAGVPSGAVAVSVKRIGFSAETKRVTVPSGGEVTADFTLARMAVELSEIVTTATGEQSKVQIGNAIATLKSDSIAAAAPIKNVTDMLEGRVAGLMIFQNSGVTGSAPRIRIDGFNSVSQSNAPIMIIDGVRVDNTTGGSGGAQNIRSFGWTAGSVTSLNPDEIESIEIVKGPAAATLYGTDAANGVIVIKTKQGKPGDTRLTFHDENGVIPSPTRWNNDYYAFGHTPAGATVRCSNLARVAGQCTFDSLSVWDPMKQSAASPLGTGKRESYGMQASGGVEVFKYFASADVDDETGYLTLPRAEINRIQALPAYGALSSDQVHPNYDDRVALRGNATANIGTLADLTFSNAVLFQKSQIPSASVFADAAWGSGYNDACGGWMSCYRPGELFSVRAAENLTRVTSSVHGNYTPLPWLSFRGTTGVDFGADYSDNLQRAGQGAPVGASPTALMGSRLEARNSTTIYSGDVGGTASFDLPNSLTTRTTVGGQLTRYEKGTVVAQGTGLPPGGSTLAGATTLSNSESTIQNVVAGGYVEEMLGWRDRLFVTPAIRADGASSFGRDFHTAFYPKAALSWLMSNEGFFPKQSWVNSLRYRAAYGFSGVQPASTAALTQIQLTSVYLNGATQSAGQLLQIGNSKLRPERTAELETGFDAELIDGRFNLIGTVYQKQSSDGLVQVSLPRSVGVIGTGQLENVGAVRNRGWELTLNGNVFRHRGVALDVTSTASANYNLLTKLDPTAIPPEDRFIKFVQGYPIFTQWDRPIISYNPHPANGILLPSDVTVSNTVAYLGPTNPTHLINVTPDLSFLGGQLRLTSMFVYKGGYIQTNFSELNKCSLGSCQARNDPNAPIKAQAAYLAFAGPTLTYQGYEEDGTFTRWAEASIVWDASKALKNRIGSRSVLVTLSARNLHVWTKYTGLDPEVSNNPELNGNFGTIWDLGYDNPVSPPPRYYILRITLGY